MESIRPQRLLRVDTRRLARGHEYREERDEGDRRGRYGEARRIARTDTVKHCFHAATRDEASGEAEPEPRDDHAEPLTQDHRDDHRAVCAEREPQADLALAAPHEVGEEAID